MLELLTILFIAMVFEAVGVVLINKGLRQIGGLPKVSLSDVLSLLHRGITNPSLLLGVFFDALFFAGLLILMAKAEVSFLWPLTALGFVFTTLSAKFFLHEEVSRLRWGGVLLIVAGAMLVIWSEEGQAKPLRPPPTGPAQTQLPH